MDPAEQRANAVAMLRRAASLPRMKDGRRPPMHGETGGVSEGEHSHSEEKKDEEILSGEHVDVAEAAVMTPEEKVGSPKEEVQEEVAQEEVVQEEVQEVSEPERPTTPAHPTKRRSRSRSRSRGSKDMRAKMRQLEISSQGASSSALSDGPDDALSLDSPPLTSPQAYFMQLQMAQPIVSPMSPFAYGAPQPSASAMPSLQALQSRHLQGLFRSNSAAARMMAMHKLTGGAEPLDFSPASPVSQQSPTPGRSRLTRNNTVAGEERVAARQQLLRRLNERIQEKSDVEATSGNEDASFSTSKSRRRRSRRKSGSSAVVDDRELFAAAIASTPSVTPAPLLLNELHPPLIALPPSRTPSVPLERQGTPNRSPSHTPDPRTRTPTPLATAAPASNHYQYDSPIAHRGLVVEEEDDDPVPTPPRASLRMPGVGVGAGAIPRPPTPVRASQATDVPSLSSSSNEPGAAGQHHVPVLLSDPSSMQRSPFRQEVLPKGPFGSPIKERPRDEVLDEERVLFGAVPEVSDREISWVADPVPLISRQAKLLLENDREISWDAEAGVVPEARLSAIAERNVSWVEPNTLNKRMPVYDEDEDEEDDDEAEEAPVGSALPASRQQSRRPSPRDSAASQDILVDLEPTPDNVPSDYSAASHHSTTSTATVNTNARESNISDTSGTSANRGDTSSQLLDRTHSQADSMQEGWNVEAPGLASKRSADSTSTSAWSKMKNTFTRSGSSLGRRSRSNSIAREKRENTESSRESGASLVSGKRESKGDGQASLVWQQGQTTLTPSPSASASTPILLAPPPPRTGVSPIPPPSDTDAAKYINPKLFPFPGMVKLQEETLRSKGIGISASSPDIIMQPNTSSEGAMVSANSSMSSQQQDGVRDRKLSHQASDSRLLPKYQLVPGPAISGAPSSGTPIDYFNIPQPPVPSNASNTLPRTREGVKKWLSARLFPSASQQGGPAPSPSPELKPHTETVKKPSLSDLLGRKDIENISDWEDADKTRAPPSTSTSTVVAELLSRDNSREGEIPESSPDDPLTAYQYADSFPQLPQTSVDTDVYDMRDARHLSAPMSSSVDPSSATPDPASSEESPSQSSHRSRSSMDSIYSPEESVTVSAQAAGILERLDQVLRSEFHNRLWTSALNTPPRRLLLSSPMLQVANCNTVKDRFLFLFSDILVIAKPMLPDRDSLLDNQKIYPPDRKFFIKNVVHLKDVRLNVDRDEDTSRPTSALVSQRPEFIRNFVTEFAENADAAVARLIDIRDSKGCVTLGKLLVQLPEIDRAKLGEYLSRRTSKPSLRAYLDAFGFVGINIDTSLRVFLLSIHIPTGPGHANTLETLLDTFAARWYEANAGIVAFDRDLAVRLVRAVVRLNEALHAAVAHDSGSAGYSRPHVSSRDFTEAFRRHDPRGLIPDGTLEKIYTSVRHEKLCQARNPTNGRAPIPVSLKRPVPSRITYRRQSEPIVVRIAQVDPQLTIQLYGQDLTFDPPVLTFTKSTEASFRVTGTAFGPKTMIMACAGPNAPNYSGLPLSTTISVERAFMRNTFQIAFATAAGQKRKYMFSVDDPVIRHEWTGSLKRQIEAARAGQGVPPDQLPASAQAQVYRAAEALSFRVLQDTLRAPELGRGSVNGTLRRPAKRHTRSVSGASSGQYASGTGNGSGAESAREGYKRSQSRSQIYRLGAGRHEFDMGSMEGEERHLSGLELLEELQAPDAKVWTGGELEVLCQQNSAIALVLSFLQAALPYDVDEEMHISPVFQFPAPPVQRNQSQSSAYQI
ncbi:hypothetical protein DFH11DRAFT_1566213 [Phellopilus nigrolimitatus]|nr:hypothetical protein DFH11DRAFT_1566213 [Phellopilus nigrolimitatus]